MYAEDQMLGWAFVGGFCYNTVSSFFSGWLFAPLILDILKKDDPNSFFTPVTLLSIYILFISWQLYVLIKPVHDQIASERAHLLKTYGAEADKALLLHQRGWDDCCVQQLELIRGCISDIRQVKTWPIKIDTAFRFVSQAALLPIFLALAIEIIKVKSGLK